MVNLFPVVMAVISALLWSLFGRVVWADYTPLVTSASFTGIQTDVTTAAAGIVSVCLIVVGLAFLVRAFTR